MTSDRVDRAVQAAGRKSRNSDDEIRAAMLAVGSHAVDADEARDLLEMLGLLPKRFRWETTDRYGRGFRSHRVELGQEEEAS